MDFKLEDIQTKLLTASGLITDRPAWVFSIIAEDYDSTTALITIYSGRSTGGEAKLALSAGYYSDGDIIFNMPVFFKDGIYVDFTSNGHSCFVQYIPLY